MNIDSSVLILFGISLACLVLIFLMNNKKYGDRVASVFGLTLSFFIGIILLPLALGIILAVGEAAYFLNNSVRYGNPFIFWGSSVLIGIAFTYWSYKRQRK